MPMLITRSTDKPAQHSHNIDNVGSSAINGILKATNDALTLSPVFLNIDKPCTNIVLKDKMYYFLICQHQMIGFCIGLIMT